MFFKTAIALFSFVDISIRELVYAGSIIERGTYVQLTDALSNDIHYGELIDDSAIANCYGVITIQLNDGRRFRTEGAVIAV